MKRYQGRRSGTAADVHVDGEPLNPRLDLWNHSPSGFEWGYAGSGPAQLALALLADCFGDDEAAVEWHHDFKSAVVAGLPYAGWTLTEEEIRDTIAAFADAYDRITEQIIALLEKGTVPWHKTWKASTGWPRNLVTHKPYRGINVLVLLSMSYESPSWLTFSQATRLGGTVRKGERACQVVFWKRLTIGEKDSTEERRIPLLRYYSVFNLAQCEGIKNGTAPDGAETVPASRPEEIVATMPQRPPIKDGFTRAFYSLREDYVGMPARDRFSQHEDYYATLFHELVHSTGHESRLNRSTVTEQAGYGSDPYCKEELIAEIGAAFLSGHAEIAERTIDNSAAYVAEWLKRIKDDKKLIVHAAAQAQRAADFIIGGKPEETEAAHD